MLQFSTQVVRAHIRTVESFQSTAHCFSTTPDMVEKRQAKHVWLQKYNRPCHWTKAWKLGQCCQAHHFISNNSFCFCVLPVSDEKDVSRNIDEHELFMIGFCLAPSLLNCGSIINDVKFPLLDGRAYIHIPAPHFVTTPTT